jgi:hypothetical protein
LPAEVAVAALPPIESPEAVPVILVPTKDTGVPRDDAFPLVSRLTDLPDGYVINTLTVPENVTAAFEFDEVSIVVRVRVGPVVEYVPIPTSQFPEISVAE